jgi:hypothetical protein
MFHSEQQQTPQNSEYTMYKASIQLTRQTKNTTEKKET